MTTEIILKREGNLVLKKRGGNYHVYLLPFMEYSNIFIDKAPALAYFNQLKRELF